MNLSKRILFHCLPPAMPTMPSPALSVLKGFLGVHGFSGNIIYWNKWIGEFFSPGNSLSQNKPENFGSLQLLPFLLDITSQMRDAKTSRRILSFFRGCYCDYSKFGSIDPGQRMLKLKEEIFQKIDSELAGIDMKDVILSGFTSKFSQWIPALILSRKVKAMYPEIPTAIGGFGNKEEAIEVLRINPDFDFAIWGEGEYPLLELLGQLESSKTLEHPGSIARLVYREGGEIKATASRDGNIPVEEYTSPEFEDFFQIHDNPEAAAQMFFPLEASRGCHWNRCKFCYLNEGYKFKRRPFQHVVGEMETLYLEHRINQFQFLDCDIVGPDKEGFETFLDNIIASALTHRVKYKLHAEVIHHGFDAALIKKMAIAGFYYVQIGYEAISDGLLKKMDKKSDFADHILFIKFAAKYGINVMGANIIRGIVGETVEDVLESMNNLPYLRFYLQKQKFNFSHSLIQLRIQKGSRFYRMVEPGERERWNFHPIYYLLPDGLLTEENRFNLFSFTRDIENKVEWEHFETLNNFYHRTNFTYQILDDGKVNYYSEFMDGKKIKYIVFDDPKHWNVLQAANEQVISLDQIFLKLNEFHDSLTKKELIDIIEQLFEAHLLYANADLTRLVTVIDVDR